MQGYKRIISVILLMIGSIAAVKGAPPIWKVNPETGETQAQFAARTRWWRHARFGMFIHWGIYAVPADSSQGAAEWYFYNHTSPDPTTGKPVHLQVRQYAQFAKQFDPVKFNAKKWAEIAKQAGMRYIVITSKHHDGFCMFHTKLNHYNIVDSTPFHHDPMVDLSKACRKEGLKFCFYYSFMDWHNYNYLPRRAWDTRPTTGASLDKYVKYAQGQLRELLTQYGPIGVIWFDGGWEHNAEEEHSLQTVKLIRSLQPNIIINNRLNLPEDFGTPEQTVPGAPLPGGQLWETCMTINNTWGYSKNDHDWKSSVQLIRTLCTTAGRGGNFLLNVGPKADGTFPAAIVQRLHDMGEWMHTNSQSIYDTVQGPFSRLPYEGSSTLKGDKLYLQVFDWPASGLTLHGLDTHVLSARALLGNQRLQFTQKEGDVQISEPKRLDPAATVVELQLVGEPEVVNVPLVETPAANGNFLLTAEEASILGDTAHIESLAGIPSIGYWTNSQDKLQWTVQIPEPGIYNVQFDMACQQGSEGSAFQLLSQSVSGVSSKTEGTVEATGPSWQDFKTVQIPSLSLPSGRVTLTLLVNSMPNGAVMNLRDIQLIPH